MRSLGYWLCRILGWHKPSGEFATFDGFSHGGVCTHCRQRILQDSNGDWFAVGPYLPPEPQP